MSGPLVVIFQICVMFLVMGAGYVARRRGYVDAATTGLLSGFTTDVALPAMTFARMIDTVDARTLKANWLVAVLTMGVLLLGQIVGWAGWRLFCSRRQAATFIFVVSIANWIYLPLPIVQSLYGAVGVQILLLCNVGAQVYLWTVGVATLHGGRLDRRALWALAKNPGLYATVAGIALALVLPAAPAGGPLSVWRLGGRVILDATLMIGSLTIPLALLLTGAQLGAIPWATSKPQRPIAGVLLLRMILTPLIALALICLAQRYGLVLDRKAWSILFLIAAMPVAVSCSIMAERFRQETNLAAQSIFYTTLVSIATVPLAFWLFERLVR